MAGHLIARCPCGKEVTVYNDGTDANPQMFFAPHDFRDGRRCRHSHQSAEGHVVGFGWLGPVTVRHALQTAAVAA